MTIPTFLPYYVLLGTAGIITAVLIGLNRALEQAHWPVKRRKSTVGIAAAVLALWLAAAAALAALGTFQAGADTMPTIQYAIALPILIGGLLIWRSETVKHLIEAVPQSWLVGLQLYRALGVIFLILYATGRLPGLFAWPAGVGDILVGVLAPVVAIAYARAPRLNGDLVAAWNWFGIGDLVIAVATGFITAPSLLQPFMVEPANHLVTLFPLALIPTFLVPLSILLHIASLTKLRRTVPNRQVTSAQPA
ncbi:hypothetical protein AUC71_04805 [Methyloceanibacter marginalis]|uniref:Uncharacterized protein n=1 Tax=Methyloceanibacter marginalis TaxID=1774971 RepID=A0A1E3VPJ1_9HYPH|nr:hypothetical protein [Methyloceanibacter marginalis]ODR95458.1 hypothetical protein AUC71_04805 [Methyloceanibacter marginalis]